MPVFDQLERAAFGGIEFLIRSVRIKASLRFHPHEYRHVPGDNPEKFGRTAYTVEMAGAFYTGVDAYPGLWPDRLGAIRKLFEAERTEELLIPTIGRIPAFVSEWDQTADFKVRNGEEVPLVFREDRTVQNLVDSVVRVNSSSMSSAAANFEIQAETIDPKPSIFESITDAVNSVLGVKDQFDIFGGLVESKLTKLTEFIEAADRQVVELRDPLNYRVLYALQSLLDASLQLQKDLSDNARDPRVFIVPATMSVAQISARLYNHTERSAEIMTNNPLEDPFSVQAGQEILYFEEVA